MSGPAKSGIRYVAAAAADVLALMLVIAGALIDHAGSVRWHLAALTVTATSGWRAFGVAAMLVAVRHAVVPRPSILHRGPQAVAALGRLWRARRAHATARWWPAIGALVSVLAVDFSGGHNWPAGPASLGTWVSIAAGLALGLALSMGHRSIERRDWEGEAEALRPDGDERFAWPPPREWIWATAIMCGATGVMLWQQIAAFNSVPDRGDPLFSVWRLAWIAHQLPRDPWHLFDANIYHPAVRTLAYSDAMLVPGVIAAPAHWLGVPALGVYTSVLLASFVAAGVAMYLLARAVTGSVGAAIVAALFFAFDLYRLSHYSHLELQFTCWMPLVILSLLRTLAGARVRDGAATGVFLSLQAGSSLYYGAFLAASLPFVAVGWIWSHGWPRRRAWTALAIGAAIAATAAALLTLPYRENRSAVGERGEGEAQAYSATARHYLTATRRSAVYRSSLFERQDDELQLFPGTVPVVAAAAAFVPPVGPLVPAAALALGVTADASLGLNGSVYRWLDAAPLFRGFRVPARFRAVAGLYLALLAAAGAARLLRIVRTPFARLAAASLAAALMLVDLRPTLELDPIWTHAPGIYAGIPDNAVLVDLPMPGDADPVYVYFSTFHWHPILNGSSGFEPRWYLPLLPAARAFPSDASLDAFKRLGAEYFVLHAGYYRQDFARVAAAADAQPRLQFVEEINWEEGAARAYRLVR